MAKKTDPKADDAAKPTDAQPTDAAKLPGDERELTEGEKARELRRRYGQ